MTTLEDIDRKTDLTPGPDPWRPWRMVGLALVCGLVIVAHGCHGDEDHELLNLLRRLSSLHR